jgi:hypothetical protein
MDGEARDMHFVSDDPGATVCNHTSLLITLDDAGHEQLGDITAAQLTEEDIARPG